jgi:rhomboid family GlyGly-CTERM serine protease
MTNYRSDSLLSIGFITLFIFALSFLNPAQFEQLTANPDLFKNHEYWRLLSCNFVHFGWAHSLTNLAGFLLISVTLFYFFPAWKFILLILFCGLTVGIGIHLMSPEISQYAGFSGVLHGLAIAGCFYEKTFALWRRALFFILITAKIIDEQFFSYSFNPLHQFFPFVVAIDAHLSGALAGLAFVLLDKMTQLFLPHFYRKKESL